MANWLTIARDKIKANVPAPLKDAARLPVQSSVNRRAAPGPQGLPKAALIYGLAAGVMGVVAINSFRQGALITGVLLLLPTAALAGYAWYYLTYR